MQLSNRKFGLDFIWFTAIVLVFLSRTIYNLILSLNYLLFLLIKKPIKDKLNFNVNLTSC